MKPILGYATNPLVRHTAERDPDILARTRDDPAAARVLIAGDIPILRAGSPGKQQAESHEPCRQRPACAVSDHHSRLIATGLEGCRE